MKRLITIAVVAMLAALVYQSGIGRGVTTSGDVETDNSSESDVVLIPSTQKQSRQQTSTPNEIGQRSLSAIQAKAERQDDEATKATGLSKEQLDDVLEETRKAFFDPSTSDQYQVDIYEALVNTYGEEEAQFRMALINEVNDWVAQKELVAQRKREMPSEAAVYDQMLLHMGIVNGQITLSEVRYFVRNGAQLSEDSVLTLANSGKIDLIVQLSNAGLLADNTIRNVLNGRNAIASFISGSSYYLQRRRPNDVAADVEALYRVGVPVASSNVGIDPLDSALASVVRSNVNARVAIIERLLDLGATVEDSHLERLALLPPGDIRERLERVLGVDE